MMTAFEPISDIAFTVDDAAVQVVVQTLAKLKAQVQKLKKKKDELNPLPEVVALPSGPGPSQPKSADAAFTMSSVRKPASEEKDVEDFALKEDDGDAGDDHYMLDAIEHPIVDLSPDDDSNQPGVLDAFTNNASDKQSTPTGIDTVITKKRRGCPPKAVVVRIQNGSVANPVSNQSGVEDPNQLLGSEEATAVKSLAKQNLTPVHDPVKPQKRRGRPRKALVGDYATPVHHPHLIFQQIFLHLNHTNHVVLEKLSQLKIHQLFLTQLNQKSAEEGQRVQGQTKGEATILPLNL